LQEILLPLHKSDTLNTAVTATATDLWSTLICLAVTTIVCEGSVVVETEDREVSDGNRR